MVTWNAANAASTRFFKDPMSWRSPLKDRRRVSKVASCDVWISVLIVSSALLIYGLISLSPFCGVRLDNTHSSSCCIRPSVAFTASVLYCVQRDWMTAATAFSMSRPQHVHSSLLSLNFCTESHRSVSISRQAASMWTYRSRRDDMQSTSSRSLKSRKRIC